MADWSFLTTHARVLVCIAHDPGARLRDIAATLGITERRAHGIITDLAEAGYVVKQKDGRRNRYQIQAHLPLAERGTREPAVGEVLAVLLGNTAGLASPAGGADVITTRPAGQATGRSWAKLQWAQQLTDSGLRALTQLFWSNVGMHGTFERDLDKRLNYERGVDRPTPPHPSAVQVLPLRAGRWFPPALAGMPLHAASGYGGRLRLWLAVGQSGGLPDPGCQQDHRRRKRQHVQDDDGPGGY